MRLPISFLLLISGLIAACGSSEPSEPAASVRPDSSLRADVVAEIESLNAMRSRLARTIDDETVDRQTFARVCQPVGKQAQAIAQEHGWTVQQIAEKYRNPAHQLDEGGREAFKQFVQNPDRMRLWTRATHNDATGWRYYRRIVVESSCLACHGAKDERPAFVQQNYPEDRAYGFEVGDLRGLYAVFVPDSLRPRASSD